MMYGMTNVEYYSNCPSCGAAYKGKEFCEFCGASMVKSKVQNGGGGGYNNPYAQALSAQEAAIEQEDAAYPVIQGKAAGNGDKFITGVLAMFAAVFLVLPTAIFIGFLASGMGELWLIAFFGIFWLIGLGFFIPLVNGFIRKIKCKNGKEITGEVRGYEPSMMSINGRPVLKMRILLYEGSQYKILLLNTGETKRTYPLGTKVKLKNHKDCYMIMK